MQILDINILIFPEKKIFQIFLLPLVTLTHSSPVGHPDESAKQSKNRGIGSNDLFHSINQVLAQQLSSAIAGQLVDVGDKISQNKNGTGGVQITIDNFSYENSSFPVTFKPNNHMLVDKDQEVVPIKGDFEEEVVHKIKESDSQEDESVEISTETLCDFESFTTTTNNDQKLLKDIEEQPILTTV